MLRPSWSSNIYAKGDLKSRHFPIKVCPPQVFEQRSATKQDNRTVPSFCLFSLLLSSFSPKRIDFVVR